MRQKSRWIIQTACQSRDTSLHLVLQHLSPLHSTAYSQVLPTRLVCTDATRPEPRARYRSARPGNKHVSGQTGGPRNSNNAIVRTPNLDALPKRQNTHTLSIAQSMSRPSWEYFLGSTFLGLPRAAKSTMGAAAGKLRGSSFNPSLTKPSCHHRRP